MFIKTHIRTKILTVSTQISSASGFQTINCLYGLSMMSYSSISIDLPVPPPAARNAISRKRPISFIVFGESWAVMIYIYLIMTSIGHAQTLSSVNSAFNSSLLYRCNYIFHISLLVVLLLYKYGLSTIYIQYPSHIAPIRPGFSICRSLPGDRLPYGDGKCFMAILQHFICQVKHGDIELDAQYLTKIGKIIKEVGVPPLEVMGTTSRRASTLFTIKVFFQSKSRMTPFCLREQSPAGNMMS